MSKVGYLVNSNSSPLALQYCVILIMETPNIDRKSLLCARFKNEEHFIAGGNEYIPSLTSNESKPVMLGHANMQVCICVSPKLAQQWNF